MFKSKTSKKITEIFRNRLILIFLVMFLLTIVVLSIFEGIIAQKNANKVLNINMNDVIADISDASDNNIYAYTNLIESEYEYYYELFDDEGIQMQMHSNGVDTSNKEQAIVTFVDRMYDTSEINKVDENGIIIASTNKNYIGFDMSSGEQSSEFLCILRGECDFYVQDFRQITFDNTKSMKYAAVKSCDGGFIQVGFDLERFREDIDESVYGITKNRHVGETGYIIIVNEEGTIVSSPYANTVGQKSSDYGISLELLKSKATGEPYEGILQGKKYDCLGSKFDGYYIFALIPREETMSTLTKAITATDLLELLAFAVVFTNVFFMVRKLVVKNIEKVASSLEKISKGNLDVSVEVRGTEEFDSLSDSINTTVRSLKESAEKEVERINSELEYAKNIQRSSLPMLFPPFPERTEFEIYATMDPAKEVGGDFFDFELLSNNLLGFCVADVSGKGIPAALLMMKAKTLIKSFGIAGLSADEILSSVNKELCSNNDSDMFVTCWLGILNTETGVVEYANAGHNPPLVRHADGGFEYLNSEKPNFVLGGMEGVKYTKHETNLESGDEIFVYTDGVTEATNDNNELFGEERLRHSLDCIANESCENKCIMLRKDIDDFVQGAPQFDDITMLSLKFFGSENTMIVSADMENYDRVLEFIESRLDELSCPAAVKTKFNIAADEIVSNICKFAYGSASGKMAVKVEECKDRKGASITFLDRGVPFNPLDNPDPDITLSAEDRTAGSLGIYMVKKLMDNVEYEYSYGNKLTITKFF